MAFLTNPEPQPKPDQAELSFISLNPSGRTTLLLIHGAFSSPKDWIPLIEQLLPPHLITNPDPTSAAPREDSNDASAGSQEASPLLNDHGGDEDADASTSLLPSNAAINSHADYYHILVPSLPLHSTSSHIGPLTIPYTTALLASLVTQHAKNGQAHVIGLSLGAHIASALASSHPELVSSLFVSGFNIFPRKVFTPILPAALFVLHGLEALVMAPREEVGTWKRWVTGAESPGVRYRSCEGVIGMLFSDRELGRIDERIKVLVVAATLERWVPKDRVDDARRLFHAAVGGSASGSGSRVVQHTGLGHPWPVDEPELMGKVVRAWVEKGEVVEGFEDL
ncbi:alpha/beta-hydrolase [Aspergillus steynii IBT 23096]|uniref:Alpha/beta-hydrolase n=1 Tax=Aspergillus steynii IBT 23096 TaxID=1392250 RepID=A0A2I2G088_9EURO|nr:alpha/beta-hydrolase [Aspergillus steynii IBT 23096]PLB46290.1 alpha/beta-hydrolase [Aspergillus steynii IBT 23096]